MNIPSKYFLACFTAVLVVLSSSLSYGDDVFFLQRSNSNWDFGFNWSNNVGPADGDYVFIPQGTLDFSTGTSVNLRGFRQTSGTLNISGGTLRANNVPSAFSSFDGEVNQTGGTADINAVVIGSAVGTDGSYTLNDGELVIGRASGGVSLRLGANRDSTASGTGSLTIAGGRFVTRSVAQLGSATVAGTGNFTVLGSQPTEIGIAGSNDDTDGVWHQHAGSSLILRFDNGGCTPIVIHDSQTNTNGTSATFENGAILDVDHLSGDGGGTWTVLEVENGDIVDNGLAFAPGVDTSVWSFSVDNSGANGRLLVTATGTPAGFPLFVGNTRQQRMRYGMDYERLWFWTGGLNASERDDIAKWSAIDTRIDYIRVAINAEYELVEGTYDLRAYTDKIIPLMQEMKDANPDLKFFASPRPLHEAYSSSTNVAWQPYPLWITGDTNSTSSSNFNFKWEKCAEYLERYILLMKSYGFKISFMDLTNEWQSNDGGSRITQADYRDITEYLKANLDPEDMPLIVGPSSWNYSQGESWIRNLDTTRRRNAVDIAAGHNTNRPSDPDENFAATVDFAQQVRDTLGPDTEIWNTEVHGWKSTSSENETTSFYFMLEKIRAGFSGLNGWLAIGTTNQGHAYILNPSGTPRRNVKYFIFKKLSETSNYGHALDIISEPSQLSHTAALIKGNLMTVWVINQGTSSVPIVITPAGRTISESTIKRTRWTDPDDVEGFVTHEPVASSDSLGSSIPAQSVCCFEILLEPEEYPYTVIQAEDEDARNGLFEEQSGDVDGTLNLGNINDSTWARYNDLSLVEDSAMRFRVARPAGREDGWVEVYLGSPGASTASILAGTPVGKVAVPETGNWQVYQTIEACLESAAGEYDVVLNFDEVGSTSGGALFNLNSFSIVSPDPPEPAVVLGDCNLDGFVNFLDIAPFISILTSGPFLDQADCNEDGAVNFLDIAPFIELLGA